MAIGVGLGIVWSATGRRRTTWVSIWIIVATAWRAILVDGGTRAAAWRTIAIFLVIATGRWSTTTVVFATWRVTSWWTATAVILIARCTIRIGTTAAAIGWWRARSAMTLSSAWWRMLLGIGDSLNGMTFELGIIQLLDSATEIGHSLVFDKATTIPVATDFGIDNVQSGLAGEVF